MKTTPTALEILAKNIQEGQIRRGGPFNESVKFKEAYVRMMTHLDHTGKNDFIEAMLEHTKLHVAMALEAAAKSANLIHSDRGIEVVIPAYDGFEGYNEDPVYVTVNKESILNAYPENQIK